MINSQNIIAPITEKEENNMLELEKKLVQTNMLLCQLNKNNSWGFGRVFKITLYALVSAFVIFLMIDILLLVLSIIVLCLLGRDFGQLMHILSLLSK